MEGQRIQFLAEPGQLVLAVFLNEECCILKACFNDLFVTSGNGGKVFFIAVAHCDEIGKHLFLVQHWEIALVFFHDIDQHFFGEVKMFFGKIPQQSSWGFDQVANLIQ